MILRSTIPSAKGSWKENGNAREILAGERLSRRKIHMVDKQRGAEPRFAGPEAWALGGGVRVEGRAAM